MRPTGGDVWLFTGCVMDAWMRDTHRSTARLIELTGATFAVPDASGACCGALHVHAGLGPAARRLAERTMHSMPGEAPIIVNSAGCGAAMKDYGHLLGTDEAASFAARVLDVHQWLAERLDRLPEPARRLGPVIVQDPCHLRHVQRAHEPVRAVLSRVADVVELDDDGLCCGAGGAYSALQPELATAVRQRKVAAIARAAARTGATVVASRQPWLRDAPAGRRPRRAPPHRPRRSGPRTPVSERVFERANQHDGALAHWCPLSFGAASASPRRRWRPVSRYEDLAERLEAIGGELDELSFDILQQAVADGATQRPPADRALTQARRAVEKAAGLLRQLGS